jgi:probable F420-dependent oxidoreductase
LARVKFGVRITRSVKISRTWVDTGTGGAPAPPDPVITPYEQLDWNTIKNVVLECERLGYDLITMPDHLLRGRAYCECWTTLSALSSVTEKIRLGTMVLCNEFRHPSILAKMAATLDFISGGRLEFGIGAGYNTEEFEAYGIPFHRPGIRIKRLKEAVEIMKIMWTEEKATYKGEYYSIKNAICAPKPMQKPYPPITIGGSGDKLLRVVAEHADACNVAGTVDELKERLAVLEKHCSEIGRDFNEIERTWGPWFFIYKNKKELEERADQTARRLLNEHQVFMGTPEEVTQRIQDYVDAGVTKIQLLFVDLPSLRGLGLFAEEVMPHFQR